jgi:hypothetical protein
MKHIGTWGSLSALLLVGVQAGAEPWSEYPGSVCKYYGIQENDTFLSGTAGSGGNGNGTAFKNTSGSSHAVVCPLPRLIPTTTPSAGVEGVVVNATGTSWVDTDCTFRMTSWDGEDEWVAATPDLWVSGNNSQFGWEGMSIDDWASYAVWCGTMRAGGWIQNIQVADTREGF